MTVFHSNKLQPHSTTEAAAAFQIQVARNVLSINLHLAASPHDFYHLLVSLGLGILISVPSGIIQKHMSTHST